MRGENIAKKEERIIKKKFNKSSHNPNIQTIYRVLTHTYRYQLDWSSNFKFFFSI